MRYIIAAFLTLFVTQAQAQAPTRLCFPTNGANCQEVTALNPFPVAATATITGFSSNNNFGSLTATGSSSASTALPGGGGTAVRISNTGTTAVSCTFATGAATGLVSNIYVNAGSAVVRQVGAYDHIACIDQSGSVSNLVTLEGGSGLGNDSGGGGGGSGGGGGAVTAISGAFVDGSIATIGTIADAAWSGSGNGTLVALLKATATSAAASLPTSSNRIGYTSDDACTQKVKTNLSISQNGTSSVQLIALSGGTTIYVCSLSLIAAGATTVAITTGTGSACVTGNAAVIGSTTGNIANSLSFAANGGITLGNGAGTIAIGAASSELCMINGSNVFVSGNLTYVQQ